MPAPSNSDQGNRSIEEKAFTIPVSETTCGETRGSTLADETMERRTLPVMYS